MRANIIGQTARFTFVTSHATLEGTIERMPSATGDCWIIIDKFGGLHYIQTFAYMTIYPAEPIPQQVTS